MVDPVPDRRRHILFVVTMAITLVMGACSTEISLPDDADDQLIQGSEVFRSRCAQCHGLDGRGGVGLSLELIEDRLTHDEQRAVVVDGRRRMPSFKNSLSDDDITAVVRYTREVL